MDCYRYPGRREENRNMYLLMYNYVLIVCVLSKGIQVSKYNPGDGTSTGEVTGDIIDDISMTQCALVCAMSLKCPNFIYDANSSKCLTPGSEFKGTLPGTSWKSFKKVYGRGELATALTTTSTTTKITTTSTPSTTTKTTAITTTTSTLSTTTHFPSTSNIDGYEEDCPNHGRYFEKFCYEPYYVTATFTGALDSCKKKGGYAIEVVNERIQLFLQDFLYGVESRCIWLGARNKLTRKTYIWQHSKKKVAYSKWVQGQPDGGDLKTLLIENCMAASPRNFMQWNDLSCRTKCAYMCQRRWKKKMRAPYKMEGCGDYSGVAFHGVCYSHFRDHLSWPDAVKRCTKMKMSIVEIPTEKVNKFLIYMLQYFKVRNIEFVWTGLNDRKKDNHWVWEGGKRPKFTYWADGNPSGRTKKYQIFKPDEDCVEISIYGHYKWNDRDCKNKGTFICQNKL